MVQFKQDFDNFVNKLRFHFHNSNQSSTELSVNNDEQQLEDPPPEKFVKTANIRVNATNSHCLETFIENIEQSILNPNNVNTKVFHNITKKEIEALTLKEMKAWQNFCVKVQDKDSRFVVISNGEYCKRVNAQIDRSSFTQLPHDISKSFENKVNHLIKKWEDLRILDKKWASYVKSN